jgi:hypothetical protein
MRTTEQIDAIDRRVQVLVFPHRRLHAGLPLLTLFLDFSGLLDGPLAEDAASRLSFQLYIARSFASFELSQFQANGGSDSVEAGTASRQWNTCRHTAQILRMPNHRTSSAEQCGQRRDSTTNPRDSMSMFLTMASIPRPFQRTVSFPIRAMTMPVSCALDIDCR